MASGGSLSIFARQRLASLDEELMERPASRARPPDRAVVPPEIRPDQGVGPRTARPFASNDACTALAIKAMPSFAPSNDQNLWMALGPVT